jgi:hypothetical protein
MALGAAIGQLAAEEAPATLITRSSGDADGLASARGGCRGEGCPADGA